MSGQKKKISKKRAYLYRQCQGICPGCGRKMLLNNPRAKNAYMTIDHIVPKSKGGTNNIENLRGLCRACNIKRGNNMENVQYYRDDANFLCYATITK